MFTAAQSPHQSQELEAATLAAHVVEWRPASEGLRVPSMEEPEAGRRGQIPHCPRAATPRDRQQPGRCQRWAQREWAFRGQCFLWEDGQC